MSKRGIFFLAIIFFAAVLMGAVVKARTFSERPNEKSDNGEAGVTVSAKPDGNENGNLVFDFAINNHSIDVSNFDIMSNVELVSGGKVYKPSEWEREDGSSHHLLGKLTFKVVAKGETELIIKNLAGTSVRTILWEL